MSVESIGLIGVLTLLTMVLGSDLVFLLAGRSIFRTMDDATLLSIAGQVHQTASERMVAVFLVLLIGAVAVNLTSHTRTEVYLLRVGLGSLLIYTVIILFGSMPLSNHIVEALDANIVSAVRSWQKTWEILLWPRAATALVSFWSFLHYAMNPKI